MSELEDKVVVVTGAASGIGRACATRFAGEGARVVLADLDVAAGEALAADLRRSGSDVLFVRTDVSQESDVVRLVGAVVAAFGQLDLAVNNAGIAHPPTSITDMPSETWARVFAVNVNGLFFCLKHELPAMSRGGAIVNMGSLSGLMPTPNMSAYSTSKFAVSGLTKTAAAEFAARGVRVNAICPSAIDTPGGRAFFQSMGVDPAALPPSARLGTAEQIAEAALWLLSPRSSFITGETIAATGGSVAI